MKLLLILSMATLALSQEAFVDRKVTETNDVSQATTVLQVQPDSGLQASDKKIEKRSHGWGGYGFGGYGHGWPVYSVWGHGHGHGHGHYGGWGGHGWSGWGGHGWYGGWYPGWPWWYGSGGWHGGHGGWHGKW